MIKAYLKNRIDRISYISRGEQDEPVQNGLAVTPSQMLEMTEKGIPITPQNLGLTYQEGVSKLDFEPPLEYQRGVDMAQLWEAQQDGKDKFKKVLGTIAQEKGVE